MHQATKEYEIEVSDSVDFNPSIDVFVAKGDKMSFQVPKSSKYHKVKRIQEADFLQYFNQTLYKLDQLDTCGGEYYIDTEDYAEDYELQAFLERQVYNLMLEFCHESDAYVQFKDTLYAQVQALICNGKPIGGLIIDDFGLEVLDHKTSLMLLEILEDRIGKKTTIVASQLPYEKWYDVITEKTIADAIMDRLINSSHKIALHGESMRKKK